MRSLFKEMKIAASDSIRMYFSTPIIAFKTFKKLIVVIR